MSNGLAACFWPPESWTPDTDMVQNFSPKAYYHPAVQARVAQLDQANPAAGSTSQRIIEQRRTRGTPLARIKTASVGRSGPQPMPVLPSYFDFLAPSPRPPLESYYADI